MKHQPETDEQRLWYWRGYAAGVNGLADRVSELIERQFGVKLSDGLKLLKTNVVDPYETTAARVERARWNSQFQNCPCGDGARPGHPMGWCVHDGFSHSANTDCPRTAPVPKMWGNTNAPGAVWVGDEPPTREAVADWVAGVDMGAKPEKPRDGLELLLPPSDGPPSGAEKLSGACSSCGALWRKPHLPGCQYE